MTALRPVFVDGEVLAAADLTSMETIARDREARHARHLHTPGVASGLKLLAEERQTTAGETYVDVRLSAGYAIDGTGRELVLAAEEQLSPDRFLSDNPNPVLEPGQHVSVWHPVFVRGIDAAVTGPAQRRTCTGGGGSSTVEELVEVEFGRPGDSDRDQSQPAPDEGPGDGAWRILVGFVKLDVAISRFVDTGDTADGLTVTGAGARAAVVAAPGDRVELRAGGVPARAVPALVVDAVAGGLTFGTHDGSGAVTPLLEVDSAGNLTAKGVVKGAQTAGSVRVAAGTATDGTVLALPAGVDPATIDLGGLDVSVLLSPRLPPVSHAPNATSFFVPTVCEYDPADFRVTCRGRWIDAALDTRPNEVPMSCDYLVLVSVKDGP